MAKRERLEQPKRKYKMSRKRIVSQTGPVYRHRGGNYPFEPTPEQRTMVEALVAHGATQAEICSVIVNPRSQTNIDIKTLTKYFANELQFGLFKANMKVSSGLFDLATGKRKVNLRYKDKKTGEPKIATINYEGDPDLGAITWWEKTRRGYKEGMVLQHEGNTPQGAAIAPSVIFVIPHNGRGPIPEGAQIEHAKPVEAIEVKGRAAHAAAGKPKRGVEIMVPDNGRKK